MPPVGGKTIQPGFARGKQANRPYGRRKRASPLPASRDFPRKRWQNKAPRTLVFISSSRYSTGCCAPAQRGKGGAEGTKGGKAAGRRLITVMRLLLMNPKVSSWNQPAAGTSRQQEAGSRLPSPLSPAAPSRRLVFNSISLICFAYRDPSLSLRMTVGAGRKARNAGSFLRWQSCIGLPSQAKLARLRAAMEQHCHS